MCEDTKTAARSSTFFAAGIPRISRVHFRNTLAREYKPIYIYMLAIYINSVLGKHRQSPGAESDSSIAPNISHQIASEINPWLNIDIFGLFGYHYSREAWKNNMLIYIRAFKVSGRERLKENLWAIWVDYSMVCNMNQDAVHLSKLHPQILS